MFLRINKLLIILVLVSVSVLGQNLDKLEKKAQKYFYNEKLSEALLTYQEILAIDSKHRLANYRIIICTLILDPNNTSIENLLLYKNTQGKKDKFYSYWLGRAYFHQNQFKKASESWNKFLNIKNYKSSEIIDETKDFIEWAERAEFFHSFPENYEIDQLPKDVNSESIEYSPVYFNETNELLFLSSRGSNLSTPIFRIYHSIKNQDDWSKPTRMNQFGTFQENNANIEVVNRSKKLYLYKGEKNGQLHVSTGTGSNWNAPSPWTSEFSTAKLESHFFINEEENRILFAHRKKGNSVDLDLFETHLDSEKSKWTKPELISPALTSDSDEDYPFLSTDGRSLYFSSKGFGSIGKYDVFRSDFDTTTQSWSTPVSLGYPTNSITNDIQFKMNSDENSGYFVSDRLGSEGSFDIYFFHKSAKVLLRGHVVDINGNPADHAEIHFYPTRETGLDIKTMTDIDGKYEVKVGSEDKIKVEIFFHGRIVHSETIQTPVANLKTVMLKKDFQIDSEKLVVVDEHQIKDPHFTDIENIGSKFRSTNKALISNIYFEFGKVGLNEPEKPKLEPLLQVMRENPNLQIEIAGHTDNIGEEEANLRVSKLRAQSVTQFLIEQGIESTRVLSKGYGESRPMASNDQEREGREFNRRIEVLVLE